MSVYVESKGICCTWYKVLCITSRLTVFRGVHAVVFLVGGHRRDHPSITSLAHRGRGEVITILRP